MCGSLLLAESGFSILHYRHYNIYTTYCNSLLMFCCLNRKSIKLVTSRNFNHKTKKMPIYNIKLLQKFHATRYVTASSQLHVACTFVCFVNVIVSCQSSILPYASSFLAISNLLDSDSSVSLSRTRRRLSCKDKHKSTFSYHTQVLFN